MILPRFRVSPGTLAKRPRLRQTLALRIFAEIPQDLQYLQGHRQKDPQGLHQRSAGPSHYGKASASKLVSAVDCRRPLKLSEGQYQAPKRAV